MNLRQRQNTPKHSQSGVFDKLPGFLIVVIAALIFATYYFGGEEEGNPFEGLEFERPYNPEEEKVEPKGIEDLIVKKGRGYDLAPEVRRKMEEEIYQLENAEQYALLATEAGWYSCPSCMKQYGKLTIFLLPGEVIKYGTSVRGSLRYSQKYYRENRCQYVTQFVGNLAECLIEEKRRIYGYVLLPENMVRERPLRLPPQNLSSN